MVSSQQRLGAVVAAGVVLALLAGCSGGGSSAGNAGSSGSGGSSSGSNGGASTANGSGQSISSSPLRIGVIPYENPQTEQEQYALFADYIGKKVNGQPATALIASDYTAVITALENDQVELAYLNPLGYALAADRGEKSGHPLIPIAMPYVIPKGQKHGSLTYTGVIFVRADSGINSLKDLKGKSFAFNEPTSTSGYLYPFAMLTKAGINPRPKSEGGDFSQVIFASGQGVPPAVFSKQVDAGAIFEEGLRLSYPDAAQRSQLKVLAHTDPIPNGMVVARGDLPPAEIAKIKDAFRTIDTDAAGKAAMASQNVEKWVPAQDALFNPVRQTARILKLDLKSLPSGTKGAAPAVTKTASTGPHPAGSQKTGGQAAGSQAANPQGANPQGARH